MYKNQKIAFIKIGNFSHVNDRIFEILTHSFPDFHVDVIDVFPDLLKKRDFKALFFCLYDYGWDILLKKRSIHEAFLKTPYSFKRIKSAIINRVQNKGYAFTFQTQSVFDASVPGIPNFIYTDHTHLANLRYPGYNRKRLYTGKWIECEKSIYQNASLNFTMSTNIVESLLQDYSCDSDKVRCVYCGSNVQVNDNESYTDERYSEKKILFVGIDWERKGGPVLVEAFKKVLLSHPDATLTIVGCSHQIEIPNCKVIGKVPLQEVKKYFEKASVFCLPTTIEPFGIVFLEAMAHKLPVVATKIGAIPDFIHEGENGFLVETGNVDQLANSLIRLLDSPDLCKKFGEYGQNLYKDRYNWKKTGAIITESINSSLSLS